MITKQDLEKHVRNHAGRAKGAKPIYEILMIEHADRELVYPTGKKSGFSDFGCIADVGYYYDLQDAIDVLHENAGDVRETVYDAAFVLCHFPGLYQEVGKEGRMYFLWNHEKKGYFEAEEPKIFAHTAL